MSSRSSFDENDHESALEILNSMRVDDESSCEDIDDLRKLKESFKQYDFSSPCPTDEESGINLNGFDGRKTIRSFNNEHSLLTTVLAKKESFAKESEALQQRYFNSDRSGSNSEIDGASFEQSEEFFQINGFEKSNNKKCSKKRQSSNTMEKALPNSSGMSLPRTDHRSKRESEESTTSTIEIENDDRHTLSTDNSFDDNREVKPRRDQRRHTSKFKQFIESERPEKVEYRNGRIIIPETVDEHKLMVITKKDLRDFLQDNCIDTHVLLNEIKASNNFLKMHFQESVGRAFSQINELLRKIAIQKNELFQKQDQYINKYITNSYEKILRDNQEMKKVMKDLIALASSDIIEHSGNERPKCQLQYSAENAIDIGISVKKENVFPSKASCTEEVILELEQSTEVFAPELHIFQDRAHERLICKNDEQFQRIDSPLPPIVVGQRIFNLEENDIPGNLLGCINEEVNSSYEQKESKASLDVEIHPK